jgi:hypothetical protein
VEADHVCLSLMQRLKECFNHGLGIFFVEFSQNALVDDRQYFGRDAWQTRVAKARSERVLFQASCHYGAAMVSFPDRQGPRMENLTSETAYEEVVIQIAVRVILEIFPFTAQLAHRLETNVGFDDNHQSRAESGFGYGCTSDGQVRVM